MHLKYIFYLIFFFGIFVNAQNESSNSLESQESNSSTLGDGPVTKGKGVLPNGGIIHREDLRNNTFGKLSLSNRTKKSVQQYSKQEDEYAAYKNKAEQQKIAEEKVSLRQDSLNQSKQTILLNKEKKEKSNFNFSFKPTAKNFRIVFFSLLFLVFVITLIRAITRDELAEYIVNLGKVGKGVIILVFLIAFMKECSKNHHPDSDKDEETYFRR